MKELETQIQQNPERLTAALSALPRDRGGRISWKTLRQEPGRLESTVEQIARLFMENGVDLTNKSLNEASQGAILAGIHQYYPGELVGLRNRLGISQQKPFGYWRDKPDEIEREARQFFEAHGRLSLVLLSEQGRNDLVHAVTSFYPGRMRQLKKSLAIAESRRPVGYWTKEVIEREARVFYEAEGKLTWQYLGEKKMAALARAISDNYPGGMNQLKQEIGIPISQHPPGYWEDIEVIREEAREAVLSGIDISSEKLQKAGLSSLDAAIYKYYPGGVLQLRIDLDLDQPRKPDGYWTPENVEEEARGIFEKEGFLSQLLLQRLGRADLASAIKSYPGGMYSLKTKLGIERRKSPKGYWSDERIEQEAMDFFLSEGGLTRSLLVEKGRSGLQGAVNKYGITKLKLKLGIELNQKPKGYWTSEQTEKEALDFFEKEGALSTDLLRERGRLDLLNAINGKYEGRMTTLREKLGITEPKTSEEIVDSNRANEQLTKLVEATK